MKVYYLSALGVAVALTIGIYFAFSSRALPDSQAVGSRGSLSAALNGKAVEFSAVIDEGRTASLTPKDIIELKKELRLLKDEVGQLKDKVSSLQWALSEQTRTLAQFGANPDESQGFRDPNTEAKMRENAEGLHQERMAKVEADFQRESTDTTWATHAEASVQKAVVEDNLAWNALRNIECRSHTCRIEMTDDNSGGLSQFIPLLGLQLADILPNISMMSSQIEDGSGGNVTILYLVSE
ncbi:MAG: hypothetical protein ACRESZ_09445 [Methylococcales bacterium]